MARLLLGFVAMEAGLLLLGRAGALELGVPWTGLAMAPVLLAGGLLMGLHLEPPPWRRHRAK